MVVDVNIVIVDVETVVVDVETVVAHVKVAAGHGFTVLCCTSIVGSLMKTCAQSWWNWRQICLFWRVWDGVSTLTSPLTSSATHSRSLSLRTTGWLVDSVVETCSV